MLDDVFNRRYDGAAFSHQCLTNNTTTMVEVMVMRMVIVVWK